LGLPGAVDNWRIKCTRSFLVMNNAHLVWTLKNAMLELG